ncbi:MAG: Fe-S protein assembly co-chaperone HscB [Calditrichaeota bacterium]|nr:MAG: Fe-S protein assembly co-chaperone HscB [Calditrichota bacterium]
MSIKNCWNCEEKVFARDHFCLNCKKIQPLNKDINFFEFLGFRNVKIDLSELRKKFITLNREFHPDFFYNSTELEQEASLERSTFLNKANQVLKDEFKRAKYLVNIFAPEILEKKVQQSQASLTELMELKEDLMDYNFAEGEEKTQMKVKLNSDLAELSEKMSEFSQKIDSLFEEFDNTSKEQKNEVLEKLNATLNESSYVKRLAKDFEEALES